MPKVENGGATGVVDQHVRRFDVAVGEAEAVDGGERSGHAGTGPDQPQRLIREPNPGADVQVKGGAAGFVHREPDELVVGADVVHPHHVGEAQRAQLLKLPPEPCLARSVSEGAPGRTLQGALAAVGPLHPPHLAAGPVPKAHLELVAVDRHAWLKHPHPQVLAGAAAGG